MAKIDGPGPRDHAEVALCHQHAMALHAHDYGDLAKDATPRRAANLEAADKRKDVTIETKCREREPEAGADGRWVSTADRRSQTKAAVEAGRQAKLEKIVEHETARPHHADPPTRAERSAAEVPDPDLGQGPLTHKDPVFNKDVTELMAKTTSVAIAAAHSRHVPHMELADQVNDAAERSGFDQYPLSRINIEAGVRMKIQDAKEHLQKVGETLHVAEERIERFRSRTEDARYPAQRDERGFGPGLG